MTMLRITAGTLEQWLPSCNGTSRRRGARSKRGSGSYGRGARRMSSSDPEVGGTADTALAGQPALPARTSWPPLPKYDVGEQLGRGGMGEVFVARDTKIGRRVAVKRMLENAPSDQA